MHNFEISILYPEYLGMTSKFVKQRFMLHIMRSTQRHIYLLLKGECC